MATKKTTAWRRLFEWWTCTVLKSHYRCRCGVVVLVRFREEHEEFHASLRDFFRAPSAADFAQIRKVLSKEPRL